MADAADVEDATDGSQAETAQLRPEILAVLEEQAKVYDQLRYYSLSIFRYLMYTLKQKMAQRLVVKESMFTLWIREIVYAVAGIPHESESVDADTNEARSFVMTVLHGYYQYNTPPSDLPLHIRNKTLADSVVDEILEIITSLITTNIAQSIEDYAITIISKYENKVNEYGNLKYEKNAKSDSLIELLVGLSDDTLLQDYPEFQCIVNRRAETSVEDVLQDRPLLCYDLFYNLQYFLFINHRPYTDLAPRPLTNMDVIFDRQLLESFTDIGDFPVDVQHVQSGEDFIDQLLTHTNSTHHTTKADSTINAIKISLLDKTITFVKT